MVEPGLDRHEWETEWEQLEPLVVDSPAEALPELDDLVRRMIVESGYPLETNDPVDDEGIDPEVLGSYRAAHEVRLLLDRGEDFDPGDVGQAIGLYREIYQHLLNREVDLS
ncbi:MAG TPA: hypothetical protein VHQ96_13300 [Gaiellaceae bacterium]|jgi:hypothetical protein|nr:hypothetical protein [Gaiellaceae bacterium]